MSVMTDSEVRALNLFELMISREASPNGCPMDHNNSLVLESPVVDDVFPEQVIPLEVILTQVGNGVDEDEDSVYGGNDVLE